MTKSKKNYDYFNFTPKKQKILSVIITFSVGLSIFFIHACNNDKNITGNENIAEGFRAEVYRNGKLETDQFATGLATVASPLTDAYIDIEGHSEGYSIYLSFSSKTNSGIDGFKPGALDSKNFSEPFLSLRYLGESVVSGYIESSSNEIWFYGQNDSKIKLGSASGEIIEIGKDRVVGKLQARGNGNDWEIRKCEFNLKLASSDYIGLDK